MKKLEWLILNKLLKESEQNLLNSAAATPKTTRGYVAGPVNLKKATVPGLGSSQIEDPFDLEEENDETFEDEKGKVKIAKVIQQKEEE